VVTVKSELMLFLPKNPFLTQNTLGTAINLSMALKHLENHLKNQNQPKTKKQPSSDLFFHEL